MNLKEFINKIDKNKKIYNSDELLLLKTKEETEVLENFSKAIINKNSWLYTWSIIFDAIAEAFQEEKEITYLNDKTLLNLLKYDELINDLSHLPLPNKWLLKIYNHNKNNIEALLSCAINHLYGNYDVKGFLYFIKENKDPYMYGYLLYTIIKSQDYSSKVIEKGLILCMYIFKTFKKSSKIYYYSNKYLKIIEKIKNKTFSYKDDFDSNDILKMYQELK